MNEQIVNSLQFLLYFLMALNTKERVCVSLPLQNLTQKENLI
jgi:hypothetical protein